MSDNGIGFDVATARRRAIQGASAGLLGLEERVELAGGRSSIVSTPGQGTVLRAWLPLANPHYPLLTRQQRESNDLRHRRPRRSHRK